MSFRLMMTITSAALLLLAESAAAQPTVVVTPLESSNFQLGRHAETAQAYIEDALVNQGHASIVERKRMDDMVQELGFSNYSGLADVSTAARFGRMLGANFLVQGTLMDLSTDVRTFSGYGVRTRNEVTEASVRVRVLELESGRIAFSKIFNGSVTTQMTSSGGQGTTDAAGGAVRDALQRLVNDAQFQNVFASAASGQPARVEIPIQVRCMADPCDVEVDGLFVGNTPIDVPLVEGSEVELVISKVGHEPWVRRLMPRVDMTINAELEPRAR